MRNEGLEAELWSQLNFWTCVGVGFGWLSFVLVVVLVNLLRVIYEQRKEYRAALDFKRCFSNDFAKYKDKKPGIPLETLYKASEN